jgi:integrase/recombinase XerD
MARMKMRSGSPSIAETFDDFLLHKKSKGTKEKTLQTYGFHIRSISKYLDLTAGIGELSKKDLEKMVADMRDGGSLTDSSISSYVRTLKSFLSWCNAENITSLNIPLYHADETLKDTYTLAELKKLIAKPNVKKCGFTEFRNWVIVNLLLNSGCRASTIRSFRIKDVNLPNRTIAYRHTKNGKVQIVPLCEKMVSVMREYLRQRGGESNDVLFPNENGKPLTESGLRQAIETYNTSRGVAKTSIHLFRHTFAEMSLRNGINALMLQKLLGHSTLAMTKHYCNIYGDDMVNSIDAVSPLNML